MFYSYHNTSYELITWGAEAPTAEGPHNQRSGNGSGETARQGSVWRVPAAGAWLRLRLRLQLWFRAAAEAVLKYKAGWEGGVVTYAESRGICCSEDAFHSLRGISRYAFRSFRGI